MPPDGSRPYTGQMTVPRFFRLSAAALFLGLTSASGVEPAHQKAIEELLELAKTQQTYESSVIGAFESSIKNSAQQIPEAQRPKFEKAMERIKVLMLEKMGWEAMKPDIVNLYASTFTLAELEAVLPLMRKPEMRAFVEKSAPLAAEAAKLGGERTKELQPEIMKIVQEEMLK